MYIASVAERGDFHSSPLLLFADEKINLLCVSGNIHSELTTNDVETNSDELTSSEEIPVETLQCPLPEPSRAYPFCQENVVVRFLGFVARTVQEQIP